MKSRLFTKTPDMVRCCFQLTKLDYVVKFNNSWLSSLMRPLILTFGEGVTGVHNPTNIHLTFFCRV